MLNSLYALGKLWIKKENLNKIDVLLDVEKLKKNTRSVILVELNQIDKNSLDFDKVSLKEYGTEDNLKYLYRSGSSRGTDITPSCLITEPEKSFNNKFFKWFEQNHDDDFLKGIFECLSQNKDKIFEGITDIFNNLSNDDNKNVILTLVINDEEKRYVGDYEIFKDILVAKASEKYYKAGSKKIKGISVCFLCDQDKEVYGLVSNSIGFAFSTPDKKGNVSELKIENQWKHLPICGDCALYLEAGKKFVETYLSFKEFGLTYYVIPNFLFDSEGGFDKLFRKIKRFEGKKHYVEVAIKEDKFKKIVDDLDDVLEFKFMFYQSSNNAFNILAYVESILPSWMRQIFETQELVLEYKIFSEEYLKKILSKNISGDLISVTNSAEKYYPVMLNNWYLGFLRNFFSGYSFKYYLEIVNSVLSEKQLDFSFLLSRFMGTIRENWRNQNDYAVKLNTLRSLALILLFDNLNLLREDIIMNEDNLSDDVIQNILNTPDKKATFLLGVLTRKLVYVQYNDLGSSPFVNKLWGLSLDKKKIQKLYPMVLNKLQEYKRGHYYSDIQKDISVNLIKAENNWKLSRDETSYYFVLGYTLAFAINKGDTNGETKEE